MILIDAIYVNNSGGKVLLDYLMRYLETLDIKVTYLLDERIKRNHFASKRPIIFLKPSLIARFKFYHRNRQSFDLILCFGNVPPVVRLKAVVFVYFHQTLFLEGRLSNVSGFGPRLLAKRIIVKLLKRNTDFWIVQTESVKSLLMERYRVMENQVKVIPFYPPIIEERKGSVIKVANGFVYVSSGAEHKNHRNMIQAFRNIYNEGYNFELHMTVSEQYNELFDLVNVEISNGLPIINHGSIPRAELDPIYARCKYVFYPSLTESFGLGILEGLDYGCDVIGSDRAYLHAICEPSATFDPDSIESMESALRMALGDTVPRTKRKVFNEIQKFEDLIFNFTPALDEE